MKKRSKSSQPKRFSAIGLLKKTAIGSLVGATVLGMLPSTIGIVGATPISVEAPLIAQGGWQSVLKPLNMMPGNNSAWKLSNPRGLFAAMVPFSSPPVPRPVIVFSDSVNGESFSVLGIHAEDQFFMISQPLRVANSDAPSGSSPLFVNELALNASFVPFAPGFYGTASDDAANFTKANVYGIDIKGGDSLAQPLLAPGSIKDAKGLVSQPDGTIYVAGGKEGIVWKLTRRSNNIQSVVDTDISEKPSMNDSSEPADNASGADPESSTNNMDSANNKETLENVSDTGISQEEATNSAELDKVETTNVDSDSDTDADSDSDTDTQLNIAAPYIAEPIRTFNQQGSDLTDILYEDNKLYVADAGLDRIVRIDLANEQQDAVIVNEGLDNPQSIAMDSEHDLYIASTDSHQVKKINVAQPDARLILVAGNGDTRRNYDAIVPAVEDSLTNPVSVAVDQQTGEVYIADKGRIQTLEDKFFYKQTRDDNGKVWNLVENAEGLDRMRDDLDANYRLDKNISASELQSYLESQHQIERTQSEASWMPIGKDDHHTFKGRFDGGGHTIEGLRVLPYEDSSNNGGLFGYVSGADIRNVRLTGVDYSVLESAGGLAASITNSAIEKVSVEGTVRGYGQNVGGFAGALIDTSVKESYFNGKVEGRDQLGGFAGMVIVYDPNNVKTIENSYAWSEITDQSYDNRLRRSSIVGGFVGYVSYEGLDNGSTNSLIPTIFKNTYASTEFNTIAPALDASSDIITGRPFEGVITDGQPPYKGVSSYWDSTFPTLGDSYVASKLTTEQMKKQDSFVGWDFNNIWTLQTNDAKRAGYPTLKAFAAAPTTPTNPTTPSNPSTGGGTSTPVVNTPAPTNTTTINVNVQNNTATNGAVVASLTITRTKGTDGTVKDQLQLTPAKAKEILDLLKTSGSKTAAIVLPDAGDEVSEWNVNVPKDASAALTAEGVQLVILNPNVRISVPASSLTGLTDDLYFRLIPVKSTATSTEIQQRALGNAEIVKTANGGDITVVGRPMTIETNLQSRPVTLTLPLPANSTFTAAQQQKLGVYIEHSDGTKQLVRGKVVTLEDGKLGLEISVNHFSTFTIVNVSKWGGTLNAAPYIMGYADGSFKPAQDITRAELAAIVSRITGVTEGSASFSDVKNGSWASTVVGPAAASGIMTGYSDGTFKPNASITRGELAAALAKLLPQSGLSASASAAGFGDLNGHWAASAAAELQAAGVVTGYADGSFKPEQAVTRAEAVTMINRLIGLDASMTVPGASEWSDVSASYWAHDAIRAASMAR